MDIGTKPSMAFYNWSKLLYIVYNNLLNLISSWFNTVFIEFSGVIGCIFSAISKLNFLGSLFIIFKHNSFIISSGFFPDPPAIHLFLLLLFNLDK